MVSKIRQLLTAMEQGRPLHILYPIYTDKEADGWDSEDDPTGTEEEMITGDDLIAREEMVAEDHRAMTAELVDTDADDDSLVRQRRSFRISWVILQLEEIRHASVVFGSNR
jgi:hypothetical protein